MLSIVFPALAQTGAGPASTLPNDPREVLAAAAPFYDFSTALAKPWHLKATYQMYDQKGDPADKGTYEYWWASPQVNRSTWSRTGATHSEWHTADGKQWRQASGEPLNFFEYKVQSALLSPLPESSELDPVKFRLERDLLPLKGVKIPCVMVIPVMPQHGKTQTVPLGLFPTYCFDPKVPALRISYSFGTVTMEFNKIVKTQNRYLPREILMAEGKRQILSVEVDAITAMDAAEPSLTPPAEAKVEKPGGIDVAAAVAVGSLFKKQPPVYPQDAKDAGVDGRVVLKATIGTDGGVHELHVVSTPWPSLTAAALVAVSQWQYKPYLLNGEPVEVHTEINVIYSLGR